MKIYVVYDRSTGEIVHTHTSYVLGNDEPVAASEDEIRAVMPQAFADRDLAISQAPEDADLRSRDHRLEVAPKTGEVRLVAREGAKPRGAGL